MRQSNRLGVASFTQVFSSEYQRMHETTLAHPEVAALLVKLHTEEPLTPIEHTQAVAYANRLTNQWLGVEVAHRMGLVEPDYHAAIVADVRRTLSDRPRLRGHFQEVVAHYPIMRTMPAFSPLFEESAAPEP